MQPTKSLRPRLDDEAFRDALRGVATRTGWSLRKLSLAMGRDPGYVAALLDPTRPSRARPTPEDLLALSDASGIPLTEVLVTLWAIPPERLTAAGPIERPMDSATGQRELTPDEQRTVAEFAAFLAARPPAPKR